MRRGPLIIAFILLCLMAVGGGNALRQKLNPGEVQADNSFFAGLGNQIKGLVRSRLAIDAADHTDAKLVRRGKDIYADHCAACHGANLEGETPNWRQKKPDGTLPAPPHDVTGHTWHHTDEQLFAYTKKGGQALAPKGFKSAMPAFEGTISDGDIWAVLSFIKNRWPEQARQIQPRSK